MVLTKKDLEEVLKTLPIGYYLGKGIDVVIDEYADTSYFNESGEIHISSKAINKSFSTDFKEHEIDDKLEILIRDTLYHEINHVMMSDISKMSDYASYNSLPWDVVNIVEDARVNLALKGYYLKVDFDWGKRALNDHWEPEKPTSAMDLLYQATIYKEYMLDDPKLNETLKGLVDMCMCFATVECNIMNTDRWVNTYFIHIKELWDFCLKQFHEDGKITPPTDGDEPVDGGEPVDGMGGKTSKAPTDPKDGTPTDPKDGKSKDGKSKGETCEESPKELSPEEREKIGSTVKKLVESIKKESIDTDLLEIVHRQLSMKEKRLGSGRGGYYSHSGKFDYNRIKKDQQKRYDWFKKESNRFGDQFAGTKLNLFIDVSGSFYRSQDTINRIIRALIELEKIDPSFSIDVITIGERNTLLEKRHRSIYCSGGNVLYPDIFDIYKKVNLDPTKMCYNIVCFDGDALSMDVTPENPQERRWCRLGYTELAKNFRVWNNSNCYIITNPYNLRYTDQHIDRGHVIVTKNYADELRDAVIRCLKVMIK